MIESIADGLQFVLEIIKRTLDMLTANTYGGSFLKYGIAIGIAVSIVFLVVRLVKNSVWGS